MPALHFPNIGGEIDSALGVRSVTDAVTTDADATLTSATAAFTAVDVGATITGNGIPTGTTILSVTSGTEVEMSANATATGTAVSVVVAAKEMSSPALASLPEIVAPNFIWVCIDPDGIGGSPEWLKVIDHATGGVAATVTRATEGSTARTHKSGIEWVHTLAPSELDTTDIAVQAEPPTAPEDGDLWLDTDETSVVGGAGRLLDSLTYNPATRVNASTASTTPAALDTTNLRLSFVVPDSGAVIVELNGYTTGASGTGIDWCLLEGAAIVPNTRAVVNYNTVGVVAGRQSVRAKVEGLTPGASKNWDFAHSRPFGTGAVQTNYGGTALGDPGPITMEVWSA